MQYDVIFWQIWNALMGVGIIIIVTVIVVILLIEIVLGAFFLWLGLKAVDSSDDSFGRILVTQLLNMLAGLIPCVGCILQWYIIKSRHDTSWGGAIGAWLLAGLIPIVIIIIVAFIFLGPVFQVMFGALGGLWGIPV